MTDAHCHVSCGDAAVREFLVGRDFFGVHPWDAADCAARSVAAELRAALESNPEAGVGEIGLDRLRERAISSAMRDVFEAQLALAVELRRPVVLHGAKCWGQVVEAVKRALANGGMSGRPGPQPSFLFHGFSRSDGLIPDIVALNGYISVGPSILNDHAVNYRALARKIPPDRLLVETDRTEANAAECPSVRDVLAKLAEVRGEDVAELASRTDANADRFLWKAGGRWKSGIVGE